MSSDSEAAHMAFSLSMLIAMVEKNRPKIKESDPDTFYLDRNLGWAKEALEQWKAATQMNGITL